MNKGGAWALGFLTVSGQLLFARSLFYRLMMTKTTKDKEGRSIKLASSNNRNQESLALLAQLMALSQPTLNT